MKRLLLALVTSTAVAACGDTTGPTGPKGETGPQGVQGPRGLAGAAGAPGATGAKGPTGDTGPDGYPGLDGVRLYTERGNLYCITREADNAAEVNPSATAACKDVDDLPQSGGCYSEGGPEGASPFDFVACANDKAEAAFTDLDQAASFTCTWTSVGEPGGCKNASGSNKPTAFICCITAGVL